MPGTGDFISLVETEESLPSEAHWAVVKQDGLGIVQGSNGLKWVITVTREIPIQGQGMRQWGKQI